VGYEWVLRVSYVQRARRGGKAAPAGDATAAAWAGGNLKGEGGRE
jgi:hypothetical protein